METPLAAAPPPLPAAEIGRPMPHPAALAAAGPLRFGDFTLDPRTGELRRDGELLKIPPQPARALQYLVEQGDRLVTREELQRILWSDGRHVDFEQGLNYCVRQLREILGDDAEIPRYIATVPRRGYRFVAPVIAPIGPAAAGPARSRPAAWALGFGAVVLFLASVAAYLHGADSAPAAERRLVVLPLAAPSASEEDRLAAHVLHEELQISLAARAPRLAVVTSPAAENAGPLEAPFRLEGSVYRVGEELTLALRLVRSVDGVTLWGRTFRQGAAGTDWLAWPPEAAAEVERVLLAGAENSASAGEGDAAEELATMERSFAGVAGRHGVREAFLAYLAPDAVVFRPAPVLARPLYTAQSPGAAERMSWAPVTAVVASSGELGYTTGPWTLWGHATDVSPSRFGQFLSIWRRQEQGPWRVLADSGIAHPEPTAVEPFQPVTARAAAVTAPAPTTIEQLERDYCAELADRGLTAFSRRADPKVRLLRDGHSPVHGREAALALLGEAPAPSGCAISGSRSAVSQDLAAAWGVGSSTDGRRHAFLRVWQREADAPWRLTVDLATTLPADLG